MMKLELLLAFATNLRGVAQAISFVLCILAVIAVIFGPIIISEFCLTWEEVKKPLSIFILVFVLTGTLSLIPSIDDLWRVRIGLIKLQLASPENIQKGSDVIERIGQKLECKYLGCEEKKK